jgi:hypothetical protein
MRAIMIARRTDCKLKGSRQGPTSARSALGLTIPESLLQRADQMIE